MTANNPKRMFEFLCWIPVTVLVCIELYVRNYDGWGAWSTAPLFLIPILLSFLIAGIGVFQCFIEVRKGAFRTSLLISIVVALLPLAWILIRRHIV